MQKITLGKKTLIASALMLAMGSSMAATLKIGVASNFEIPLRAIVDAYKFDFSSSDTITVTGGATGTLKAAIISGGSTNGPYDLFLAANQAAPVDLVNNYSSLVEGSSFTYATGYLTLWSNTSGVNVSSGLPSNFYSLYGQVAIADHITAPYGAAAWTVLQASPHNITSLPDSKVAEYTNIDTTFQAVNTPGKQIGFVAKSQVCQNLGAGETFSGTSHYVYTGSPIVQAGVAIERTSRSGADDTLLSDFINYLRTNSNAQAIIQQYCYS
ncbi:MAG: molybdate ABC transporter substrate-binding protein [Pseudomonadota bacterium]